MAMGYRNWAGIGTSDDCGRAVRWYEGASEQGGLAFLVPNSDN
jgi:TPR repeat protein